MDFAARLPRIGTRVDEWDDRRLFYALINREDELDLYAAAYRKLQDCFAQTPNDARITAAAPAEPAAMVRCVQSLSSEAVPFAPSTRAQAIERMRQYAPTALLEGCWLQTISTAATCHREETAHLFSIYAGCIGYGRPSEHHGNRYRQTLNAAGIDVPAVTTHAFSQHPGLFDAAYQTPVVQLCLSLFPRVLLAELIGYTLAHVHGLSQWPPLISQDRLAPLGLSAQPWAAARSDSVISDQQSHAAAACHAYLAGLGNPDRCKHWQRIRRGFALYGWAEQAVVTALKQRDTEPLTPRDKMIDLLKQKAPYARGHHRAARIGGQRIDDWFGREPFAAEAFLEALAHSEFVSLKAPLESRLLTELTAFGGPMFRVFNKDERAIIFDWLESLPDQRTNGKRCAAATPRTHREERPVAATRPTPVRSDRTPSRRRLFYRLLNSDRFPDALPAAKSLAARQLRRAAATRRVRQAPLRRFFAYDPDVFAARITALYEQAINAYRPFKPPPRFDKAVYVWGIEQMAPTVLVDGCWLQRIAAAGNSHEGLSAALFQIYSDEIGNGQTRLNHPNVYRRLLNSLNIQLPPIDDPSFAAHPGFLDAAFDLPVYLLAIGHFPRTFLPEIIGLNLAIELSGLGAHYMRLVDELDHWGIDSSIVRLHISIDTLAGGHAAIAREGVRLYLDHIRARSGHAAMQEHWARLWTGFLSLHTVPKRFALAMLWHYAKRFALPKTGRRLIDTLGTPGAWLK